MANEQNLIPIKKGELSSEEAKKRGSVGGKRSAEVRKEKKLLKELLEEALSKQTKTGNRYIDMVDAIVTKAERGSEKAFEVIRDTLGQKPTESFNLNGNINNPMQGLTTEELKKLANKND